MPAVYWSDVRRTSVAQNQGFILAKCAFQMIAKSPDVATKLDDIAGLLRADMPEFRRQMMLEIDMERGNYATDTPKRRHAGGPS